MNPSTEFNATTGFILKELREVLIRVDKPFKLSEEDAEGVVTAMKELAVLVNVGSHISVW
jgi:hypothetical protein